MKRDIFTFGSNQYAILIGTTKYENFQLIDESFNSDVWFHIQNEPSCHVILKHSGSVRELPKQVIKRCAYLCKINSKAKTQPHTTVIYTALENVVKTDVIGQVHVSNCKTVSV